LGWSREQIDLGVRANWCCEYCGQYLLENPDAYASWQVDHIVPVNAGGSGELCNLAIACHHCNFLFKNKWDPRPTADPSGSTDRDALIRAVRVHVQEKRNNYDAHLREVRAVIAADPEKHTSA
jgi:5-methylcytosine-specific restriction endonuclease McrA